MANPRNEATVAALRELLADAKTFFVVDYQGLSAGDLGTLRASVRAAGGRLLVAKNTLINVVLKEQGIDGFDATLKGPTALVLIGDGAHVYVLGEGDVVERRRVTVGQRRSGEAEILDGLAAGERVVVRGVQKVREGQPVRVREAEAGGDVTAAAGEPAPS